jgi:predicted RNA-binding protein associated with RNAse of E/G family
LVTVADLHPNTCSSEGGDDRSDPRHPSRPDIVGCVRRFTPGEPIVLRERWHGRTWAGVPAIAVEDREDAFLNHVPHGVTMVRAVDDCGSVLRLPQDRWSLREVRWTSWRILGFQFPGRPYAVLLFWDPATDAFAGYYVNVETTLARTDLGLDYVDHLLDVRISADRSEWSWKDEDELDEAVSRGIYTQEDARSFRTAGERGVAHVLDGEPPFDADWSTWTPDPGWPTPALPAGWDLA